MGEIGPHQPDAPTTRLCVKNLPKHCDDAQLKKHFGTIDGVEVA